MKTKTPIMLKIEELEKERQELGHPLNMTMEELKWMIRDYCMEKDAQLNQTGGINNGKDN